MTENSARNNLIDTKPDIKTLCSLKFQCEKYSFGKISRIVMYLSIFVFYDHPVSPGRKNTEFKNVVKRTMDSNSPPSKTFGQTIWNIVTFLKKGLL
jgi:hypothetical protein